ncbi:DUF4236 domain-containing protein [Mycobacterium heckeshornense]|uniref:Membrane protein n=1 Tax=Mycobacterium heckeshornense TaxID=110505 RepID=A0A7R7GSP2_9MYCO|nr:DUF4236 domain-containing protein [Mycobacterium heckeshornense]MCV7033888.1 DUF4236 domain-containing protein [Mycobacterium heckeshornense]BCO35236.1 membrane protein [Mycobacterium heckeshornense]
MGFYIRKYVKVGPFRLNLSKSGLGVSVGVPGFRIGSGPRGNYVHIGRYGLYYRTAYYGKPLLGGTSAQRAVLHPSQPHPADFPAYNPSDVVMHDVTGATAVSLVPTVGDDLVKQLNAAATMTRWGWLVTVASSVLGLMALLFSWIISLVIWVVALPLCWWLFLRDQTRSTVVAFYDVNDAPAAWFDSLVQSWGWLMEAQKLWRVVETGHIETMSQWKRNAGADHLATLVQAMATTASPPHLSTNIAVPSIAAGNSSLHFLPDRVLVREGKRYSDVAYRHLQVRHWQTRFIESGLLPTDAQQVDQTWLHPNVRGGPDRRFTNNRLMPVMQYGRLELSSPEGLCWQLQISRAAAASAIASVLSSAPGLSAAPGGNQPLGSPGP